MEGTPQTLDVPSILTPLETPLVSESTPTPPLYSEYRDDPEFRELLAEFVPRWRGNRAAIEAAFSRQDWKGLADLIHQLKGVGGAYGFPELTERAIDLFELIDLRVVTAVDTSAVAVRIRPVLDLLARLAE